MLINIEIKSTTGTDALTGERVAKAASELRKGMELPLLSSFSTEAL